MTKSFHTRSKEAYEEIEDISTVSLDDINIYDIITNYSEVAGVLSFDDFLVCLVCKSKVQPADATSH